jgi:pyrroline-5-carboxylate reductase
LARGRELIHSFAHMNDHQSIRVGVLGAGNMGSAIIRGLVAAAKLSPKALFAADAAAEKLKALEQEFNIVAVADNRSLVAQSDVVIIAVKPQLVSHVLAEVSHELAADRLFVSIAAGVTTAALQHSLGPSVRVVRTMPNTPAMCLAGVTAITKGAYATAEDLATVFYLFEALGPVVEVEESMLDAVTGLSGSGPAYVLLAIEALADGGVLMGLPRQTALLLAAQTVYGTAKMVLESKQHPAQLRDNVTSPGGTTIAGIAALESAAVRHSFMSAVKAATLRSQELGKASARK